MDRDLINKLWQKTISSEEKLHKNPNTIFLTNSKRSSVNSPTLLSASLFLSKADPIFMSFHTEGGNANIHYHDFFEILYVCKGTPIGVINNQKIHFTPGALCIMNPNAVHHFKNYKQETDLILNIVLPKEQFEKSIFQILFHDPILNAFFIRYRLEHAQQNSFLYLESPDKDIDYLITLLLKEYLDHHQYSQVIMESLLTLIFSFLLRSYRSKASEQKSIIDEIITFIYTNNETITIDSVAAEFGYHPKYLSTLIHKYTGETFRSIILNIKLQNALHFLLYTDYPIDDIIELIGYKDQSSFYRIFKRKYGVTPTEYRIQNR